MFFNQKNKIQFFSIFASVLTAFATTSHAAVDLLKCDLNGDLITLGWERTACKNLYTKDYFKQLTKIADIDNNNRLSESEFLAVQGGFPVPSADGFLPQFVEQFVNSVLVVADTDKSGKLSGTEFTNLLNIVDTDANKRISEAEWNSFLIPVSTDNNRIIDPVELQSITDILDSNLDKKISSAEWKDFVSLIDTNANRFREDTTEPLKGDNKLIEKDEWTFFLALVDTDKNSLIGFEPEWGAFLAFADIDKNRKVTVTEFANYKTFIDLTYSDSVITPSEIDIFREAINTDNEIRLITPQEIAFFKVIDTNTNTIFDKSEKEYIDINNNKTVEKNEIELAVYVLTQANSTPGFQAAETIAWGEIRAFGTSTPGGLVVDDAFVKQQKFYIDSFYNAVRLGKYPYGLE